MPRSFAPGLSACAVVLLVAHAAVLAAQHPAERAAHLDSTAAAVPLWPAGAPGAVGSTALDTPTVTPYLPPAGRRNGTAVVIFPGGGYEHVATAKEGDPAARWLNTLGIAGFVVRYRLGPRYHYPAMLQDAQRAVQLVRARAAAWHIDPARIGVMGFSAGGHMASLAGTHFDTGEPASADSIAHASSRPDFMILLYPVITMRGPLAHQGSRRRLLGDHPTPELEQSMSSETQVTARTPPAFIVATTDDATVPVENSLLFYQALHAAAVPVELHIFETGRHGFGLAPADPVLSRWTVLCAAWMQRHGWANQP